MILEIDCGNSYLKWRYVDNNFNGLLSGSISLSEVSFNYFSELEMFNEIEFLLLSAVIKSDELNKLTESFVEVLGEKCVFVALAKEKLAAVTFGYDDVSRLGVDRCLAMVAAYQYYPKGVLVVDCGSAITIDFVNGKGSHLGGYILPGLKLLKSSLIQGTSNILVKGSVEYDLSPGLNTEECVVHGGALMVCSTLIACIKKAREFGISDFCITGGDALAVKAMGLHIFDNKQNLVFEGLEIINPFFGSLVKSKGEVCG